MSTLTDGQCNCIRQFNSIRSLLHVVALKLMLVRGFACRKRNYIVHRLVVLASRLEKARITFLNQILLEIFKCKFVI
jgi:hypothetical protein